jgi:hypothetical protein
MKRFFLIGILLLASSSFIQAQFTIRTQAGISYIEHLSTGLTFHIGKKHNFSLLYGSNLFIRTYYFSNQFVQYDREIPKWKLGNFTPHIGVKGGNSLFTNSYYRWKVVSVIPFAGMSRPVSARMDLRVEAGVAFAFEQTVKRISLGEMGLYKERLPEFKAALLYTLSKK